MVLRVGPVPLAVLEMMIDDYIAEHSMKDSCRRDR